MDLSDVATRFDAIEADVKDRYDRLVTVFDRWRSRVDRIDETVDENGGTIDGLVVVQKAHTAQLADRKHDYDAVLLRLAGIVERVERAEALASGQQWRSAIDEWKAYTNTRFDAVNRSGAELRKRQTEHGKTLDVFGVDIRELQRRAADVEQTQDRMLLDVDPHEHCGDWCPAQTGIIADGKRPSTRHLMHTCIVLGVHVEHRCSCNVAWISQTSPIGSESDSERPGGRLVTRVRPDAAEASASLSDVGRAESVAVALSLVRTLHEAYVLRGYAHPHDAFSMRANLRTLVLLLGGGTDAD